MPFKESANLRVLGVVVPQIHPFAPKRFGCIPGASGNSLIANGALNRVCFAALPILQTTTFASAQIDVRVAGALGARVRFGVWRSLANGFPGALLLDSGQVNVETVGDKSVAFTQTLLPDVYWIGGCYQGVASGNLQSLGTFQENAVMALILGIDSDTEVAPSVLINGVAGALPDFSAGFTGVLGGGAETPPAVTLVAA